MLYVHTFYALNLPSNFKYVKEMLVRSLKEAQSL